MKKLFRNALPLILAGVAIAAAANAQVSSPNYFKQSGTNLVPINATNTIGSSSVNGSFNNLNISGTCTGSGCAGGGGSSVPSSSLSAAVRFPFPFELAAGAKCGAATGVTEAGACMQDIYNNLSSVGGSIWVPFGTYNATSAVIFGTNGKLMLLSGALGGGFFDSAGTNWNYLTNGTSTINAAFTFDANNFNVGGTGIQNMSIVGPGGSGNIGSSTLTSSYGVVAGKTSNGAFGFTLMGVNISSFGTGLLVATNTSFLNIVSSNITKNGQAIYEPQTNGANGENMRVTNSVIADCNSLVGSSIADDCILIQQSGNVQWHIAFTSLDDAQLHSSQFGGTANIFDLAYDHCEDPNTSIGAYDCIVTQSSAAGAAATVISVTGGDFMQDKTSSPPAEFISFGGTLILNGVTCDINNNVTNAMAAFATPLNSQATISWHGMANKGFNSNNSLNTGCTNMYGSFPYTVDGLGYGTSTPAFSFSTSTSQFGNKVQVLSNDLEDANGNKYSTSTPAAVATTTPFTAGCLPVVSSSLALTNSAICQVNNVSTTVITPTSSITLDTSGSSFASSVTSSTVSYTTSGSNRILFVGVIGNISTDVITGVTYNGVSMTLVGKVNTPSDRWTYLFSLVNPASGAHSYTVSASTATNIATDAVSYDGVSQTGQPDATSSNTATATTTITTSITTATNNDWAMIFADGPTGATANASGTNRVTNGGAQIWDSNVAITPASAYAIKLTGSSSGWGTLMASFAPFPAVTTTTITSLIGINTTTPTTALSISGQISQTSSTNALALLSASGTITAYGGSSCSAGSTVSSVSATGTVTCANLLNVATSTVTAGNGTVLGSNYGGVITITVSAMTSTINFSPAWIRAPVCTATAASSSVNIVRWLNITTSSLMFTDTNSFQTSSQIDYICQGNPN